MERKNIIDRIKSRFRREPDGLEDILYKKLKKFQNTPLHLRSREQYDELLYTVTSNKDTLYELLFSKKLKKDDNCELMVIGMFGEHQLAEDDAE